MNSGYTKKHLENTLRVPKKGRKISGGVVDVKIYKPDIYQLFSGAKGIIHMVNAFMKYFLKLFDVEVENGLSPFYMYFASKD